MLTTWFYQNTHEQTLSRTIQSASWRRRFPPFNLLHDLRFILRDPRDKRRKASSMQSLALQAPMIQFRRKQGTKLPCDYFCVYHLHVRKEHRAAFCSINSSRPLQCYGELGTCLSLSWIICNCTYIFWEVTHWSKENCIIQTYSKFPKSSDESFFFFFCLSSVPWKYFGNMSRGELRYHHGCVKVTGLWVPFLRLFKSSVL